MKAVTLRKWLLGISASLSVTLALMPTAAAYADTYPYFKEYGGDVSAGGWFDGTGATANDCTTGGYYQDYTGDPSDLTGGILTYANSNNGAATGGSSSQYAAFALGNIDSTAGTPNGGFYSDGAQAQAGTTINALSFANYTNMGSGSSWGGDFDGGVAQLDQCIPDYYDTDKPATPNPLPAQGLATAGQAGGAYTWTNAGGTASDLTSTGPVTIPDGTVISVFVSGNVYISNNITYQAGYTADNVPKFSLVVQGNIDVAPGVSELDGLYIAQPDQTSAATISNTGVFWSCHDNTATQTINANYVLANCGNKLTVNGALIAKQLNFTRINGDVGSATTAEDSVSGGASSNNIAEVINFTPAMVIGGGFFNQSSSPQLESLISLPPVF